MRKQNPITRVDELRGESFCRAGCKQRDVVCGIPGTVVFVSTLLTCGGLYTYAFGSYSGSQVDRVYWIRR